MPSWIRFSPVAPAVARSSNPSPFGATTPIDSEVDSTVLRPLTSTVPSPSTPSRSICAHPCTGTSLWSPWRSTRTSDVSAPTLRSRYEVDPSVRTRPTELPPVADPGTSATCSSSPRELERKTSTAVSVSRVAMSSSGPTAARPTAPDSSVVRAPVPESHRRIESEPASWVPKRR